MKKPLVGAGESSREGFARSPGAAALLARVRRPGLLPGALRVPPGALAGGGARRPDRQSLSVAFCVSAFSWLFILLQKCSLCLFYSSKCHLSMPVQRIQVCSSYPKEPLRCNPRSRILSSPAPRRVRGAQYCRCARQVSEEAKRIFMPFGLGHARREEIVWESVCVVKDSIPD